MTRKISNAGVKLIKSFEGCKLTAYKPVQTEQYWTIGWGHNGPDVRQGQKITQAQADSMLLEDLAKYEAYVNNPTYVPLTDQLSQNQFDALVSFTYNCGQGNLKKLCNGRKLKEIGYAILLYDKSGGKVLAGLTRRRKEESALFFTADKTDSMDKKEADVLEQVTAIVNGTKITDALLKDGRVYIQLRAAGDNIPGSKIGWDQKTKTATLDTPIP
ncbi:glycoside hydrolase family protein [Paenibacillus taichungensis]|uniref:glycoside hydrolase family protein n=1 Tax=Paenibacillus taichungensis TaxID=484184 RepID=UPI002DBE4C72|nr:glycoside hydrolase family protein [Paenibacillus taichungensis]MEC0107285.1 glycoside hydrolase family protein [Paenibacillus taichungensis]MEC0194783.1 glycoside hydrolase family protein [Paenibacillus taichungensis]